jgi:hypothetical protein
VRRVEPIRHAWIGALWNARLAVRAGISLDDYLRARFAHYLGALPVPRSKLPLDVDVDAGQILVRSIPATPATRPDDGPEAWLAPLVAVEGPAIQQEISHLEVRAALLDGEIDEARRHADDLSRKLAADIAAGIVAGPPEVNATAEQLGRPPIRGAALRSITLGFAAAALAAETWQVVQPLLRTAGVDPANLPAEAQRRPAEVTLLSLFALGVASGLFALAHAAVGAAAELLRGDSDRDRRRWLSAATVASCALAGFIAAAVASLPAAPGGAKVPASAVVLLLVAVPLAATLALRRGERAEGQREEDLAGALAWDRERARALGDRARRLEELAWADDEQRARERERDLAQRRLKEISARAVTAARHAAEAERRERAGLARLAQSLVGALELDRYEFVRQASARGAHELLAARRRSAPEPRPAFDEPTAPVAAPVARVEAGRLAS